MQISIRKTWLVILLLHGWQMQFVANGIYCQNRTEKKFHFKLLEFLFLGPMFHPELHGSLSMFRAILKGEKLKQIPNNSMSFIDVRDLAQLELAALENNNARGMT